MSEAEVYCQWRDHRQDHPLLNSLILGKVFQHLRGVDLKECRLVCKAWSVSTIPFIRKAYEVTICGSISRHSVENFVEVFRSNRLGIPFARFKLWQFCTTEGAGQEFLQLCGETTQSFQFSDEDFMVEDVSTLLRATPKLEIFHVPHLLRSRSQVVVKLFPEQLKPRLTSLKTLNVRHDDSLERNKYCPTFLEELITAGENISCLSLDDMYTDPDTPGVNRSSLQVLRLIEKLGRESSIQELNICDPIKDDSEHVEILRRLTAKPRVLKLKRFEYNTYGYEPGERIHNWLFQFLPHVSDTLEYLTLGDNGCASFMTFPKFPRLKELSLKVSEGYSSRFVNLKKIFPVLQKLDIWYFSTPEMVEFFPQSDPCPTMKSFQPIDICFNNNAFNQMLHVFPNLTNLRVLITLDGAVILRLIWSRMTQLKSLSIYGTLQTKDSMDSVLTGIPTHALQEVRDSINNMNQIPVEIERREIIMKLKNQHSTLPAITNLTNLKSLSLEQYRDGDDEGTGRLLTDLSGYLGFYLMKSLKHLSVRHSELTNTCCEIMTKDMGLESWTFRTSEYEDIIPYQRS